MVSLCRKTLGKSFNKEKEDGPGDYEHTPEKKECQDNETGLYLLLVKLFDSK